MALPSARYEPRRPAEDVLYQIVQAHFETFRAQAASLRDGEGLPRFVEQKFRDFLRCGWLPPHHAQSAWRGPRLAGGFARFHCTACGLDRLVAFSCKGRGFCPSCGGRRMAERAAHLVDHVFPDVPVRQWVLSLPYRLRYRLAWDHDLCRAVVAAYMRAVLGWLRRRARLDDVADGRGGAVAVVQRFGGALNLNVHIHALVLDGVFAKDRAGALVFHPVLQLTDLDVAEVLATVEPRIARLLSRLGGGGAGDVDPWAEEAPVLAGLGAASVQGTVALGPQRGARIRRLGAAPDETASPSLGRCHARSNGFDLHAGLVVPAGQRDRLERVCRYALRPPVATERLRMTSDGQVCLQLRQRWADGTLQLVFDPVEFLGRLAVLVPRPRINLVLYHGVLGPRAAWRAAVVRRPAAQGEVRTEDPHDQAAPGATDAVTTAVAPHRARGRLWADLMRRAFGFDVLACPRCGGRLRLIALIDQASVIQQILGHLGLPTEIPASVPARAPPRLLDAVAPPFDDDLPAFDPGC